MPDPVYLRHKVGWCPVCGAPILDSGYDDDPEKWEHAETMGKDKSHA